MSRNQSWHSADDGAVQLMLNKILVDQLSSPKHHVKKAAFQMLQRESERNTPREAARSCREFDEVAASRLRMVRVEGLVHVRGY